MTQGPSNFIACRSDGGPYKVLFSPASMNGLHVLRLCLKRLPQISTVGVSTTALLRCHQN